MRSIITASLLSWLSLATPAQAQTYYVDATLGNDANDGRSETAAWRTISKISSSSFLPGDSILLKCGEKWREQLDIPSSGTATNPIRFSSYPAVCPETLGKPEVAGSEYVTGWSQYSGNIYVTNVNANVSIAPRNLILNGSVDVEQSPWGFTSSTGGASLARDSLDASGSSASGSLKFTSGATAGDHHLGSNTFSVQEGKTYQVKFKVRADAGKTVGKVIARMAGVPWTWYCGFQQITVDDVWREYTNNYCTVDNGTAPANEKLNASFYIYLYPDYNSQGQVSIYVDDVSVSQTSPYAASVQQVFVDGQHIKRAHYPNKGYLPTNPSSVFLTTANYSGTTSYGVSPGQNFLFGGTDLDAAGGGLNDLVGAGIHIRSVAWRIEDRTVSAWDASSRKITFVNDADPSKNNTEFTILKGWGYYLDNKLWMLDEPGEWYFENDSTKPDYQNLYLWLPEGLPGGSDPKAHNIEVSVRDRGMYAYSKTGIIIDGIRINYAAKNGIELNRPVDFALNQLDIRNSGDTGIWLNGSGQAGANVSRRIESSSLINSARQGIHMQSLGNVMVTNNVLTDSGTVGSPVNSLAAISAGYQSDANQIIGNTVTNSGYIGIRYNKNSLIQGNIVDKSCLVLSDCGAIYTYNGGALYYNPDGTPTGTPIPVINSQVTSNIVTDVIGGTDGSPTQDSAAGIYLDGYTNGVVVSGNTVVNASNGVHANSPFNINITNNTFFGSRWSEIDFSNYGSSNVSSTSVHDNAINSNLMFSLSSEPLYHFWASYNNTAQFCTADNNYYSSMYTTTFFRENLSNGTVPANNFTYSQWQQTTLRDLNSVLSDAFGIAPVRVESYSGNNLVQNPIFDNGLTSWSCANGTTTCLSLSSNCASGGNCLRYTVPVTSYFDFRQPSLNIQQGVDYLFEFDIRAGKEDVPVSIGVIWPPYTDVSMNRKVTAGTSWKSYSFIFRAPSTQSGLLRISPAGASVGDYLEMDNFRLEPVTPQYNDISDDAKIVVNKSDFVMNMTCADSGSDPARCGEYVQFPGWQPVTWPIAVSPKGAAIVVWSSNPMKDTDRDGVPDQDDVCPTTSLGVIVRANGCSFEQTHDPDFDATYNGQDNCPTIANPDQRDSNGNGIGDACDPADLAVSISATPNPVTLGGTITYTATVTNNGPSTSSAVTVSGLAGCTLPSSSIPSGGTASCSVSVVANSVGTLSQIVTVSGAEADPNLSNNIATIDVTVIVAADLAISMATSATYNNNVFAGEGLAYTLNVANTGPSDATGVVVTDSLPSGVNLNSVSPPICSGTGTLTCSIGNLLKGGSFSITITVTPMATGVITNTASVSGHETDLNSANNNTSAIVTVNPAADLSITTTGTPASVYVNDTVTYAVTVTNNGPSTAGSAGFTDTLGSGLSFISVTPSTGCTPGQTVTCALGSLAKGTSSTVNITAKAGTSGTLTNTAAVTSIDFDPLGTNNSASTTTTVNPTADLALTLTGTPNPVYLGSTETYTLTVTNLGPSPATNISVTGTLPSCTFPSLAANTSTSCTRTATATSMSGLSQTLSVTATELDRNTTNNSASLTTTVIAPDLTPTALTATKSGSRVYVSDTVTNQGSGNAGPFTVSYYLSTNTTYETTDLPLVSTSGGTTPCTRSVTSLIPGATSSVSNKICYKPSAAVTGTKYYVLVVDDSTNQVIELNEANSVRATTGTVKW